MNLRYRYATFHADQSFSDDATLAPLDLLILLKTVVYVYRRMFGDEHTYINHLKNRD